VSDTTTRCIALSSLYQPVLAYFYICLGFTSSIQVLYVSSQMLGPGIPVAKQFGIAHLVAQWKKLEWIYVWVDRVYGFKSW